MNPLSSRARAFSGAGILASLLLAAGLASTGCSGSEEPSGAPTKPAPTAGSPTAAAPAPAAAKPASPTFTGKPDPQVTGAPGHTVVDQFHPAKQAKGDVVPAAPEPRRGGRIVVHLDAMPKHLNYMTENSAVGRWIMHEVHDYLVFRDWDTWEETPVLAKSFTREDSLILKGGKGWNRDHVVYGDVTETADGYTVTPRSPKNALEKPKTFKKDEVESVQRGTVFTFELREGVTWHDGHPFDANDVYFSWQCYQNPTVDCEDARPQLGKLTDAEVLGPLAIRFFYAEQYFLGLENFDSLQIVPSHIYNLSDHDNEKYKAGVDPLGVEQGNFVNDNDANIHWIGLGPYKITEVNDQYVEAQRTDHYFNPERGGYVDTIRWRHIPSDEAAKQALLNGELDFFGRLKAEEYFGDFCKSEAFTSHLYAGYYYRPNLTYWAWNTHKPMFRDPKVRTALGMAMDWDEYMRTVAQGLGVRVTSTWPYLSRNYDHTLEPLPFDLEQAAQMLEDAGWYDRDGDGVRDKDGQPLRFEYLMTTGNEASKILSQKYKDNLEKVGVQMEIATRDWSAFIERVKSKDFDTFSMSWILDPENSPRQLWEGYKGKPGEDRSSNYPGIADPEVDRLIDQIEVEIDVEKRAELFHTLQRRLYELQPYMFGYDVPVKFGMSKRIRNFRQYGLNPGYSLRDWFIVE